jgi:hypothetical protein
MSLEIGDQATELSAPITALGRRRAKGEWALPVAMKSIFGAFNLYFSYINFLQDVSLLDADASPDLDLLPLDVNVSDEFDEGYDDMDEVSSKVVANKILHRGTLCGPWLQF